MKPAGFGTTSGYFDNNLVRDVNSHVTDYNKFRYRWCQPKINGNQFKIF